MATKVKRKITMEEDPYVPEISFAVYAGDYGVKELKRAIDTVEQCIRAAQHAARTEEDERNPDAQQNG
jgi:hypothetical protein